MQRIQFSFLVTFLAPARGHLNIVALGDWGGETDEEPTTFNQRIVGESMMRMAAALRTNFTLMMGDNFYESGITTAAENSPRFRTTFEEVYAQHFPEQPFYVLAGNHDYGENRMSNVSAQVAYSDMLTQWNFPSLWYTLHREFVTEGGQTRTVDIIALDTVVLCGNGASNEAFIDRQLEFLGSPADPTRPGHLRSALASQQWAWLEAELRASKADFLWVTGHYPIWSAGSDGSSQCLIDRLLPLLQAHDAHYMSGHDHMLEHIIHKGTNMFVVGAGKECCYFPINLQHVPLGAMQYMLAGPQGSASVPPVPRTIYGGFATLRFGADSVVVALHAHDGALLHAATPIPARRLGTSPMTQQAVEQLGSWQINMV